ncbi:hypothetical protein LC087_19250 (plasmid) [Bacillus carboniphilus]|uniref:Uncharacterized protein n=1 Tax=Bacillus carboniphilus TaxID=86663 RepID=A0ABY9K1D5_9BACI|nr:hypothetical protein [Bacillus carboniphilus]WLR44505.1 hypothetical protein LC087_19250 [Bacillus carboniphilus]
MKKSLILSLIFSVLLAVPVVGISDTGIDNKATTIQLLHEPDMG